MRALVFGAEVNPLDGPQNVARGEDDNGRRDYSQSLVEIPDAEHDEYFADESAQAGQAEASEENADCETAVDRHLAEQAAEFVEIAVMHPVVNHADQEE